MIEKLIESGPGTVLSLAGIVCGAVVMLVAVVCHYSSETRRHAADVQLKRDLLAKGLGAADIERILWASSVNPPRSDRPRVPETLSDNEHALVEKMLDDGWEMDDIERLVRALRAGQAARPAEGYVRAAEMAQ
jgi:hypothetical protein